MNKSRLNKYAGLENLRVAISAGASGIGFAIACELHRQGARVAIFDVDEKRLEEASAHLGNCPAMVANVSDDEEVGRFFALCADQLGGLDALVNNAGIAGPTGGVDEIDIDEWRRCIDVVLTGQFLCVRRAVPMLRESNGGSIVCISSSAGKHGYAYRTPYSSAKFGVVGFAQSLAKELGPSNIRVNAVLPGIVDGPRMQGVIRDRAEQLDESYEAVEASYLQNISLGRMVEMEDVATTVAFLLSDAGRNLSGQSLAVDGNVETL